MPQPLRNMQRCHEGTYWSNDAKIGLFVGSESKRFSNEMINEKIGNVCSCDCK